VNKGDVKIPQLDFMNLRPSSSMVGMWKIEGNSTKIMYTPSKINFAAKGSLKKVNNSGINKSIHN